jgi:hypothetical protein
MPHTGMPAVSWVVVLGVTLKLAVEENFLGGVLRRSAALTKPREELPRQLRKTVWEIVVPHGVLGPGTTRHPACWLRSKFRCIRPWPRIPAGWLWPAEFRIWGS